MKYYISNVIAMTGTSWIDFWVSGSKWNADEDAEAFTCERRGVGGEVR